MVQFVGINNSLLDYLSVLATYFILYLIFKKLSGAVQKDFLKSFWVLAIIWSLGTFFGNFIFSKIGIMSFIPWINNFIHTFLWIAVCLGTFYAGMYKRPLWLQISMFIVLSFIIKMTEFYVLGSWELDNFFGIKFQFSYIIGWSLLDGLYPIISILSLRLVSKWVGGLIVPEFKPKNK